MNKNRLALLILCTSLSIFIYSMTPDVQLIEAARSGNIQQAQEALAAGVDINTKYHGLAPLDYAVACRKVAMIKFLLKSGAHINAQEPDGTTVLHHCVTINNGIAEEIIQLLLSFGADVNARNYIGCTPLHHAVSAEGTVERKYNRIRLLLKAGADSNAQDNTGWTSLHYLSRNGSVNIAKLLIENGAHIQLKNHHNSTALDLAKKYNKRDLINFLSEISSLKDLSARIIRKQINQGTLTLEQVRNSVPEEVYELIVEYL